MSDGEQAENAAADTAHDVAELRNIVLMERIQNLSADEDDAYDDKCDRDLAALHIRNGREDDQHENNAARAEETEAREEDGMDDGRHDDGNQHHFH